jgi:hypothetical protein
LAVVVLAEVTQNWNAMTADGGTELSECPKCGGTDIAMILYGLSPDSEFLKEEVKKKKIVLGGCIVSKNNPELECNDCGWRY